jgi:hypothetical protein
MQQPVSSLHLAWTDPEPVQPRFDFLKLLAFSGWTAVSLAMWAAIIEAVRAWIL